MEAQHDLMLSQIDAKIEGRCEWRRSSFQAAAALCTNTVWCGGITRDNGLNCGNPSALLIYEMRRGASKGKIKQAIQSWLFLRDASICQAVTKGNNPNAVIGPAGRSRSAKLALESARTLAQPDRTWCTAASKLALPTSPTSFGVLTVAVEMNPAWQLEMVRSNRREYCKLHGYTNFFVDRTKDEILANVSIMRSIETANEMANQKRHRLAFIAAIYLKVHLMQVYLRQVDWLLWTDADVYILDVLRPLTSFTSLLDRGQKPYHLHMPGEHMTKYDPRYQFSNFIHLVKNSRWGRSFAEDHERIFLHQLRTCDSHLLDQLTQRLALASTAYRAADKPNPCVPAETVCNVACLDGALMQLVGGLPNKGLASPWPIFFDDIDACGRSETGLGLQVKQTVHQWYDDHDDNRHKWLPPLQVAISRAFSVHWNIKNPFDFDNYILFFYANHSQPEYRSMARRVADAYIRPTGCGINHGSTLECCGYYSGTARTICAQYGQRMGDW